MPSQTFFNLPQQKREALIKIALDEFSNNEYHSASISRIVKEIGIAKGSFYQYFQDKKDLYIHLLNLVSEAKMNFFQQASLPKAKIDFFEHLSWLFDLSIQFDSTHPIFSRLTYRAFYGNSSFQDPAINRIKKAASDFIRQIVIKGVEEEDIKPDIDIELAVFVVDTLINAFDNYIPEKMGSSADLLADNGASSLDAKLAKDEFEKLLQILKFGLSNR